jgi:hypothetical protein
MKTRITMFAGAVFLSGVALAQGVPSLPAIGGGANPAPAQSQDSSAVMATVDVTKIDALFKGAGLKSEIYTLDNGRKLILSEAAGNAFVAWPVDCGTADKNADCQTLVLRSGTFGGGKALTAEDLQAYTESNVYNVAERNADGPNVRYTLSVTPGLSGAYVISQVELFSSIMQGFGQYIASKKPGFSDAGPAETAAFADVGAALADEPEGR